MAHDEVNGFSLPYIPTMTHCFVTGPKETRQTNYGLMPLKL